MSELKLCPKCESLSYFDSYFQKWMCNTCHHMWREELAQFISFPILNNLTPTVNSCTAKVYEEIGELMQLLGKGQRQSGELIEAMNNRSEWVRRTTEEALDGAQSLVTLVCALLDEPNDREIAMQMHIEKLIKKGYLK